MLNKFSDKGFRRFNYFNILQIFAVSLGWTLIFLFFSKKGFTQVEFAIFLIIAALSAVLALIFTKKINFRKFIVFGNVIT